VLTVPGSVENFLHIGIFLIDCTWLKTTLTKTIEELRKLCLEQFRNQASEEMRNITARFTEIGDKLSCAPSTPQQLASLTEYLKKISVEQFSLQQRIENVMKRYSILEDFYFEITEAEFLERWELYTWPKLIKKKITDIEKVNSIERLKMIRELRSNQKDLEKTIFSLAEEASEVDQYRELDNALNVCFLSEETLLMIYRLLIKYARYTRICKQQVKQQSSIITKRNFSILKCPPRARR
jgi:hypothetical protein